MNSKKMLCFAFVLSGILLGCRGIGTQRFTALAPTQESALAASSQTVLDVTCQLDAERADYNLRENLSMLAPRPKRYKLDVTLQVERVIKGMFAEKVLRIHWLRDPASQQREVLGISKSPAFAPFGFTNGMRLRIGFDGRPGQQVRHLKILVRNE